jgi:hypothetical protein
MHQLLLQAILILLITTPLFSQEEKEQEPVKTGHRITIGLGHTYLAKGKNNDNKTVWLGVPSWSLNYDYRLNSKWAIGLQTDLVLEKFIVEDNNGQELEREKPFAVVPVGMFSPFEHFSFIAGAGVEFEKEEDLGLTRLGIEYGLELPKGWEAGIAGIWDNKWNNYSSWVLEFSFSKTLLKKRK